jgi:putative ABC transport system ATP-binding protein
MRHAVAQLGQTIVMVTHDPIAASYAGRIVFLADGRIVNELRDPSGPQAILDTMRAMGA